MSPGPGDSTQSPPTASEMRAEDALADYELSTRLATRWSGTVFAGRYRKTGYVVALEILNEQLTEHPGFSEELARVGARLARLRHPRLVSTYDLRETPRGLCLITELPPGRLLSQLLEEPGTRLSVPDVLLIADDLLAGISAAHERGVTHGDIRKESIAVLADGHVKLADLALAEAATRTSPPGWEVRYPDPAGTGIPEATDIYAASCLLSELLANEDPANPVKLPGSIATVLQSAQAPNPTQRPSSAAILRKTLLAAAESSLGRQWRQTRTLQPGSVLVGGGSAGSPQRRVQAPPEERPVPVPVALPPVQRSMEQEDRQAPHASDTLESGAQELPVAAAAASTAAASQAPTLPPGPDAGATAEPSRRERRERPQKDTGGAMRYAWRGLFSLLILAAVAAGILAALSVEGRFPPPTTIPALRLAGPVKLTATPASGTCNTNFIITATAPVRGAGMLRYSWRESTGVVTTPQSLPITIADGSFRLEQPWRITTPLSAPARITLGILAPKSIPTSLVVPYHCTPA